MHDVIDAMHGGKAIVKVQVFLVSPDQLVHLGGTEAPDIVVVGGILELGVEVLARRGIEARPPSRHRHLVLPL